MSFRVWGFFVIFCLDACGGGDRVPAVRRVGWQTEAGISAAAGAGMLALSFSGRDSAAVLSFGFFFITFFGFLFYEILEEIMKMTCGCRM